MQQRLAEIDRIASKTTFNGQNVLDGSLGAVDFQVGANVGDTVSVDFSTIDSTGATLGLTGLSVTGADATNANATITAIDTALTTVNTSRSTLGAVQNRFQSTVANLQSISESTASSRSQIQDADFAAETAAMSRAQILQQAGVSVHLAGECDAAVGPQAPRLIRERRNTDEAPCLVRFHRRRRSCRRLQVEKGRNGADGSSEWPVSARRVSVPASTSKASLRSSSRPPRPRLRTRSMRAGTAMAASSRQSVR